jgi:VWFA-related protein
MFKKDKTSLNKADLSVSRCSWRRGDEEDSMLFDASLRSFLQAFSVMILIAVSVIGQTPELSPNVSREFGWSLKRDKKEQRSIPRPKDDSRPSDVPIAEDGVVRIDTELVVDDFLVFDKKGNSIKGLTRQDFSVSENSDPQEIAMFSREGEEGLPRSIILVIDHSFSQLPYLDRSVEAAKVLVDKLYANDKMAIVTDDVELIADLTSDKEMLKRRLDSLKTDTLDGKTGKSLQYTALFVVLNEMFDKGGTRSIVIFQTDGDQLNELKPGRSYPANSAIGKANFSYDNIVEAAERAGVTVYSVFSGVNFVGIPEGEKLERARDVDESSTRSLALLRGTKVPNGPSVQRPGFLKALANCLLGDQQAVNGIAFRTGGMAQTLESPDQASGIYDKILSDMNRRYVIGYYPADLKQNGRRREIKIEVRGHPEYSIWGRKFHVAPF